MDYLVNSVIIGLALHDWHVPRPLPGPRGTSDGRALVFSRGNAGDVGLWRVAVDESAPAQRLTAPGEDAQLPAVALQQNRVAYTRVSWDQDIWTLPLDGRGGPRGEPLREIASTLREMNPQFSPDSRRIVFESFRSGAQEIWTADRGGANEVQLTAFNGKRGGAPTWSPDGQSIAYDLRVNGPGDIFVVAARGGAPRQLTNDPLDDLVPTWSHDGRWIYFSSRRTGRWESWKVSRDGGEPVQLTTTGGGYGKESPDGSSLYYAIIGPALPPLWRVPVAGGTPVEIIPQVAAYANFAVTQEGIYFEPPSPGQIRGHDSFLSPVGERGSTIDFLSFATGRTTRVIKLPRSIGTGMDVSSDGRSLLFAATESISEDLMLAEQFR